MDISSNVKILNENTLVLESDASKGDTISLNKITSIDKSFLEAIIKSKYQSEYDKKLKDELTLLKNQKDVEIKRLEDQLQSFNENKNKDIEVINSNNEAKIKDEINKLQVKYQQEIFALKEELSQYKVKLDNEINNKSKDIEIEKTKIESFYSTQIEKLQLEKNQLEKISKLQIDEAISKLNLDHANEVNELNGIIDKLKLEKNSLNTKRLGEQLEKWCVQEYNNYAIAGFQNCEFIKMNDSIKESDDNKATKPDFKFVVYLDKDKKVELTSVCLEMKNEYFNDSVNKKRNEDHYNKLDKDRNKNNLEYALLVSELDWTSTNDSPIVKVNGYEKMYMVRPQYFITFLSLIATLASKYRDIITTKYEEQEIFKQKNELIEEFSNLKNTYLIKPLNSLIKDINTIKEKTNKIIELSNQNIQTLNEICDTKFQTLYDKIEKFDIIKISKKVDKLNN